jgi:hypothetical protein
VDVYHALTNVAKPHSGIESTLRIANKQFKRNRHTLKDVMDWLCEVTGARWYVDPHSIVPTLIYDDDFTSKHFYDASVGSPGVRVIENDAIQEIVPINAVRVNGHTGVSVFGHEFRFIPSDTYPTVKAVYPPLVSRAGGQLKQPVKNSKTVTLKSTKAAAKKILTKEMQGAAGGDIVAFGKPDLAPFDHFTGVPVCKQHHISDPPPIEYEVQDVQHVKESGKEYATRFGVTVWVDPSKISIEDATMKQV